MAKQPTAGHKGNPRVKRPASIHAPIKKPLPKRPTDHNQRGTNE